MIELPLNPRRFSRKAKRFELWMLVPRRIWQGGWLLQIWSSKERRWKRCTLDDDDGYFLSNEREYADSWLSDRRKVYPHRRFRLQRINGQRFVDFYQDLVWNPDADAPGRSWFEWWGGGSPLWRMLGRRPS